MCYPRIPSLLLPLIAAVLAGLVPAAQGTEALPAVPKGWWPKVEGAVGLIASYGPSYSGAADDRLRLRPAGFVRFGRITVSGAGGFTTRRDNDVERGVSASIIQRDNLRLSLGLRWTNGRRESNSDMLAGMGDIQGTLLLRTTVRWTPPGPWSYRLNVNTDTLGHGSGWFGDAGVSRQWVLGPQTRLNLGASLSAAGDTYMQTWYGVSPEQSARSGYAQYTPGLSLRDVSADATVRHEFGNHWAGYLSTGASWQLGATAASPLVRQRLGWSVGMGLVWRF